MNKICVYTCITGDYDNLREIKNVEKGIDYYCFTNNKKIKSKTWNIVYIENEKLNNIQLARKVKILGHELINNKYDIVLWMDAAVEFKKNIMDFIKTYLQENDVFVGFKHGVRNSIYEEMDACLRFRKEKIEKIDNLKNFYKKENYKYDNGLIESTVLIKRPKDEKLVETMNLWFDMIKKYSTRDQLSFNYCIYKTKLNVKWIKEKVFDNSWFTWHEHVKNELYNSYMIYYGNINSYDNKYQYEGEYIIKEKIYRIKEIIKHDTKIIYLELSNIPFLKYNINKINVKCSLIEYHNTIDFDNSKLFYKIPGFIILNGNFKKNDKLMVDIEFEKLKDYEKNELLENLIETNVKKELINKNLNEEYINLMNGYQSVINSTSWKVTKPLRTIKKYIKK